MKNDEVYITVKMPKKQVEKFLEKVNYSITWRPVEDPDEVKQVIFVHSNKIILSLKGDK